MLTQSEGTAGLHGTGYRPRWMAWTGSTGERQTLGTELGAPRLPPNRSVTSPEVGGGSAVERLLGRVGGRAGGGGQRRQETIKE